MRYELLTPESLRWRELINKVLCDIYHFPEYVAVNAELEKGNAFAFLAEEGSSIFFFPFIIRPISWLFETTSDPLFYDAVSPYGYSSPLMTDDATDVFCDNALGIFFEELKSRNIICVFSRLHPFLTKHKSVDKYGRKVCHGSTISIDLNLSETELWQQIRRNHRDGIKKVQKLGYKFIVDREWRYWDEFCRVYSETMDRNKADQYHYFSPEYFEAFRWALQDYLHLGVILDQEKVASAGVFTEVNNIVQYHFSATADEYVTSGSSKALLYLMALWMKQRGNKIFHFGGGLGAKEDSLYRFKAGFSNTRHPFYTWRIIIKPEVYSMMVREWEKRSGEKADDIEGFFPAFRKKLPTTVSKTHCTVADGSSRIG